MKKTAVCLLVCTLLFLAFGIQPVYADQPEPPQPLVIPAEINADPYSQTVFSPNYQAVWEVGVFGEGTNYCIQACWGDPCGCASSCGYTTGTYYYYHQFRCGGSSPFYQTWTFYNGPGAPAYDSSVVYK
ncbi:MAG: hypothetical protein GYA52_08670 [Chloroflexi bacterium]|nr:hypothetical protein [Chloroflexota bacterium]